MERNHDLIALIVLSFVILITVLLHNNTTDYSLEYRQYNIPCMEYNDIDVQTIQNLR